MDLFAPLTAISLPVAENQGEVLALVNEHLMPILPIDAHLISIDGLDGSGKSAIGRAIAELSDRARVDLDEFLNRQEGRFLDALRVDDLKSAIAANSCSVVEGCLVEAVLQRLGLAADFRIYVARVSRMWADPENKWCDEHELLRGSKTASELIEEEESKLRAFCESGLFGLNSDDSELPGLRKELINYHREFAPHCNANLIVEVVRST